MVPNDFHALTKKRYSHDVKYLCTRKALHLSNILQRESPIKQTEKTSTSIEHTASIAAATVAAEYPKGDKNPAFRSFSYIIAS